MQYPLSLYAALTAFSVCVSSLALPVNSLAASDSCDYAVAVKQNQSTIFGYQLAGIASSPSDNEQTCNELKNTANTQTWVDSGLIAESVTGPICSASSLNTDASAALPYIVNASTNVFTSLIISAIPASDKDAFTYLCDNIRFKSLSAFYLGDNTIIGATCDRGGPGAELSPQPFTSLAPQLADSVLNNYDVAASKIFAWNWCGGAKDTAELKSYCSETQDGDFKQRLSKLQMVPSTVQEVVCAQQQVPDAQTLSGQVKDATSDWFATVVKNMSNASDWKTKICGYLSCAEMDKVGLDGDRVWNKICGQ